MRLIKPGETLKERLGKFERYILVRTLKATGFNKTKTALELGIKRPSIIEKISRYGITREEVLGETK